MGIVRPVMQVYPFAWAFFVPFILVTTFAAVNLIVGLIVNAMQEAHGEEEVEATEVYRDEMIARLDVIEAKQNNNVPHDEIRYASIRYPNYRARRTSRITTSAAE